MWHSSMPSRGAADAIGVEVRGSARRLTPEQNALRAQASFTNLPSPASPRTNDR